MKTIALLTTLVIGMHAGCNHTQESQELKDLKNYYGVGKKHVFYFPNATDTSTSIQLSMTWNNQGKVAIENTNVPRRKSEERTAVAFMPITALDTANKTNIIRPAKGGVVTYAYDPAGRPKCTTGYYYCKCGTLGYGIYYTNNVPYYGLTCSGVSNYQCGPFWKCTDLPIGENPIILYQSLE